VASALAGYRWDRLGPLLDAESDDTEAEVALRGLREALRNDEIVTPLAGALRASEDAVFEWLSRRNPGPGAGPGPGPTPARGRSRRAKGASVDALLSDLRSFLEEHPDENVVVEWRVEG
jgi:hypothetical protein